MPFQHFTFGWHTLQVFNLLSNSPVSYMVIPFDIFQSVQAADVEGIQSIAIDCSPSHIATRRRPGHGTFFALSVGRCSGVSIAH